MAITFQVNGLAELGRDLRGIGDELPLIRAKTLTRLATNARKRTYDEMPRVFDQPTRWTLNSLSIDVATPGSLKSSVFFKDDVKKALSYIGPQIYGGQRKFKNYEALLWARGILPGGFYTVPGRNARMTASGNISPAQIVEILSDFQSLRDPLQNRNGRRRGARYFVVEGRNGKAGGIYQSARNDLLPVLIFVKAANYRQRLDFEGITQSVADNEYATEFEIYLRRAMAAR